MKKRRLVLLVSVFYMNSSFSLEALFPALPDKTEVCEKAEESLRNLQETLFYLRAESGPFEGKSLLSLEQSFDRHKAHLSMLKGMKLLNKDYIKMRTILDSGDSSLSGSDSSEKLLELAHNLSRFQGRAKQVRTSNQILDILVNAEGSRVKTLIQGLESSTGDLNRSGDVVETFFKDYCKNQKRGSSLQNCKELMNNNLSGWEGDANGFSNKLGGLLGTALGNNESTCGQDISCLGKKLTQMRKQVLLYQDKLIEDISDAELGKNDFSGLEYRALISSREELQNCLDSGGTADNPCQIEKQKLANSLKNYRDKVRLLKKRDGVEQEIAALRDFTIAANKLRVDQLQIGEAGEIKISKAKIGSGDTDLTESEKVLTSFRNAKEKLLRSLVPNSKEDRVRNDLRVKFARKGDQMVRDLFNQDEDHNRIQGFNNFFSYLTKGEGDCSIEECQVITIEKRNPKFNEQRFFKGLEKLSKEERQRLQARLDDEIKNGEDHLKRLSIVIDKIKKGKVFQDGETLKRYTFDTLRKNCRNEREFQITCQHVGANSVKELIVLANDTSDVLALRDRSVRSENIDNLNATCGRIDNSTKHVEQGTYQSYRKVCRRIEYDYQRARPQKKTREFIKEREKRTPRYTRRGRLKSVESHHSPWSYLFAGFSQGLAENMDILGLKLGDSIFDGWLESQTEFGMEQKEFYHQYPQYQEYMNNKWVEDTFNRLNPDFNNETGIDLTSGGGEGIDLTN